MGTIEHLVTNWLMNDRQSDLLEYVDPMIDTLIEGIQNRGRGVEQPSEAHWSAWKRDRSRMAPDK